MIFHVSIFSLTDKYLFFFLSQIPYLQPRYFSVDARKKKSGALFAIATNPPKISNGLLMFKYKRRFSLPKKRERERGVKSQLSSVSRFRIPYSGWNSKQQPGGFLSSWDTWQLPRNSPPYICFPW